MAISLTQKRKNMIRNKTAMIQILAEAANLCDQLNLRVEADLLDDVLTKISTMDKKTLVRTAARGAWRWIDEEAEAQYAQYAPHIKQLVESKMTELAKRIDAINQTVEQMRWAAEDEGDDYYVEEGHPDPRQQYLDSLLDERDQLEAQLEQFGGRLEGLYEHHNEDARYMQYMEN